MKLTSSASFSPSIRISLRLKIHQAQAKNFCRVLDIRVSQIVDSDALDACCLCTPVHLMVEIAFGYRENTIFLFQTVLHFEKLLHLLAEKVGHLNGAVAFLCFR